MDWLKTVSDLIGNWQFFVPALTVVFVVLWGLERYAIQRPKLVSIIKALLTAAQDWLIPISGSKFGPVYNALLAAASAVADGNLTKDEALSLANVTFDEALRLSGVVLTDAQKADVQKILTLIISVIVHDKPAAKVALRSLNR